MEDTPLPETGSPSEGQMLGKNVILDVLSFWATASWR